MNPWAVVAVVVGILAGVALVAGWNARTREVEARDRERHQILLSEARAARVILESLPAKLDLAVAEWRGVAQGLIERGKAGDEAEVEYLRAALLEAQRFIRAKEGQAAQAMAAAQGLGLPIRNEIVTETAAERDMRSSRTGISRRPPNPMIDPPKAGPVVVKPA